MNSLGLLFFIAIFLLFSFFLHYYTFQALKTITEAWPAVPKNMTILGYWLLMCGITGWVLWTIFRIRNEGKISVESQFALNALLTLTVTQVTVILFLLGEDIFRTLSATFNLVTGNENSQNRYMPDRRKFISQLAIGVAAIPFFGFIYGIVRGKYNFKVLRETLYFEDLPEAFDGFTITQISDIHSGSFRNLSEVQKGIDLAIQQQSDLYVFTGDLVNHKADEIGPLLSMFDKIKAPFGQFSILGNHDYGDYVSWPNKAAKEKNFQELKAQHQRLGYKLLLDESTTLEKNGQKIHLLGVENWGVGFQSKGDLEKALFGVPKEGFKILLSHDPSHWEVEVKKHPSKIHLTLSGHTHGMQFGIETPVFRWSPVQYRYPNWAGLAHEAGRYLYVNRGFGFHAFSGRVGIWPEITVLKLKKKGN
ncbi:metallophosphoesterase [Pararhodonellum marinum]|uniref:metallophosphoesterase n=1 Tax=Pararhodonellum marinum TaxID=2755358 RepID=UPI00188DF080|nr:metallophosphoesterase [Pararhodonellum marinum]